MTDKNNIPQQAKQLNREISENEESKVGNARQAAEANFDREYEVAQENSNGSGTQSSDPNPVGRKDNDAKNSPGDSNPADYVEMATEVTP